MTYNDPNNIYLVSLDVAFRREKLQIFRTRYSYLRLQLRARNICTLMYTLDIIFVEIKVTVESQEKG